MTTGREMEISLPLIASTKSVRFYDVWMAFLTSNYYIFIVLFHNNAYIWTFLLISIILIPFTLINCIRFFTRLSIGKGTITIDTEGVLDTRLRSGLIKWTSVRSSNRYSSERISAFWVELKLADNWVNPRPSLNSMYVRGCPTLKRNTVWIDLSSVDERAILAAAILELSQHHNPVPSTD